MKEANSDSSSAIEININYITLTLKNISHALKKLIFMLYKDITCYVLFLLLCLGHAGLSHPNSYGIPQPVRNSFLTLTVVPMCRDLHPSLSTAVCKKLPSFFPFRVTVFRVLLLLVLGIPLSVLTFSLVG